MHQAFIVSPMLVSGIALFGAAASIQSNPSAWTEEPKDEETPIRASISALGDENRDRSSVSEEASPVTMELEPIEVIGRLPKASRTTAPRAPALVVTEPCSDWRELGPQRVIDGVPVGARRVQNLCSRVLTTSSDSQTIHKPTQPTVQH
jgi:hypothetical protein